MRKVCSLKCQLSLRPNQPPTPQPRTCATRLGGGGGVKRPLKLQTTGDSFLKSI